MRQKQSDGMKFFSQGDVWHLRISKDGRELIAEPMYGDPSDYPEAVDNGFSDVEDKARFMHLKLVINDYYK